MQCNRVYSVWHALHDAGHFGFNVYLTIMLLTTDLPVLHTVIVVLVVLRTRVRDEKLIDVVDDAVGSQLVFPGDNGLPIQSHVVSITSHLQRGALQGLHWGP